MYKGKSSLSLHVCITLFILYKNKIKKKSFLIGYIPNRIKIHNEIFSHNRSRNKNLQKRFQI